MELDIKPISGWRDENLPALMDIYQQSFPPNEQMRLSWWIRLLNELSDSALDAKSETNRRVLLAISDSDSGSVVGFTYYEVYRGLDSVPSDSIGYLYYLATKADLRGQGIGKEVYAAIIGRVLDEENCRILFFEVEKPEVVRSHSVEAEEIARRRIAWYHRNGAQTLGGIQYIQSVGWQPPMEMNIMLHVRNALSPERAFDLAKLVWGDDVEKVDVLTLEQ